MEKLLVKQEQTKGTHKMYMREMVPSFGILDDGKMS